MPQKPYLLTSLISVSLAISLCSRAVAELPTPPPEEFTFYVNEEKARELEGLNVVQVPTPTRTQEEIKIEGKSLNLSQVVKDLSTQTGRGMALHRHSERTVDLAIESGRWTEVLPILLRETGNIATEYKEVLLIYPDPNATSGVLPLLLMILFFLMLGVAFFVVRTRMAGRAPKPMRDRRTSSKIEW